MAEFGIDKWHGKKVFTLATAANVEAMQKAALVVEREVKKSFTKIGTGRSVRRTKTGKRHRASRAGQPPAIDTGSLRASISNEVKTSFGFVTGRVGPDIIKLAASTEAGTDIEYGLYLEVGTSKMAARPYLRPALRRTKRKIKRIFDKDNG